jgi:hypothetical protein
MQFPSVFGPSSCAAAAAAMRAAAEVCVRLGGDAERYAAAVAAELAGAVKVTNYGLGG